MFKQTQTSSFLNHLPSFHGGWQGDNQDGLTSPSLNAACVMTSSLKTLAVPERRFS